MGSDVRGFKSPAAIHVIIALFPPLFGGGGLVSASDLCTVLLYFRFELGRSKLVSLSRRIFVDVQQGASAHRYCRFLGPPCACKHTSYVREQHKNGLCFQEARAVPRLLNFLATVVLSIAIAVVIGGLPVACIPPTKLLRRHSVQGCRTFQ